MKKSHLTTLVVVVAAAILLASIVHARNSPDQDGDKSLDIERYPNEPFELVDLKVGGQSIKNKIAVKRRKDGEGLDNVKFNETDGWFTRVHVSLRNISGKPIVGLRAYLYLKVPTTPTLFSMPLMRSKQLQVEPLEPGGEVDLMTSDQLWSQIASVLKQYGDPNQAAVTLSVENVMFSDGLQWNRGHTLRRDPIDQNRWIPINNFSVIEFGFAAKKNPSA
jgi:hypothetical protein